MKPYPLAAETTPQDFQLFGPPVDGNGVQDILDLQDIQANGGAFIEPENNAQQYPFGDRRGAGEQEEEEEEEDGDLVDTVPCHPYGYFFLRGLDWSVNQLVPAIPPSPYSRLDERTFKFWFGSSYAAFVDYMYDGSLVQKAHPQRTKNRRRQPVHVPEPDAPLPIIFNLPNGAEFVPTPDWDHRATLDDDEPNAPQPTWNERITHLYHQLFVDVMNLIPNPRNSPHPSYCLLNSHERSMVSEATFSDQNIGKFLAVAHWRTLQPLERDQIFGYLFLKKGEQKTSCQNYKNCPYFRMWDHFCKSNTTAVVNEARKQIKRRFFQKVSWFPLVRGDRIWYSGKLKQKMESSPETLPSTAAPHLFVTCRPVWNPHARSVS